MKTVKEISELTGISIRALRYYDEIGLLVPKERSEAGYRLYDEKNLEKLNAILFLRELDVPLEVIKGAVALDKDDYRAILKDYRKNLVQKIHGLQRMLDVVDGMGAEDNPVCFEPFQITDVEKVTETILDSQAASGQDMLSEISELVKSNLTNGKIGNELLQIYGSKDRYLSALEQNSQHPEEVAMLQEELKNIYYGFRDSQGNYNETYELVKKLEENTKKMFRTANARFILLRVAEDYLHKGKNAQVIDYVYGKGITESIGKAINNYYGISNQGYNNV